MVFKNFSSFETYASTKEFYDAYPELKKGWAFPEGDNHPPKGADIWEAKDINGNLVKDQEVVTVAFPEHEHHRLNIDDASGVLVSWNRDTESVTVLSKNITVGDAVKQLS